MIYTMEAECPTYLYQDGKRHLCPCGTKLRIIAFSPLIKRKYYLIVSLDLEGIWIMCDPPGSGIWNVSCES